MAITQTRIPFGYGYCIIRFMDESVDLASNRGYVFAIDTNEFPDIDEIKYEATTIHNVRRKHVDGVHLSFMLRLREDSSLTSDDGYSDADTIVKFLNNYYRQDSEDKSVIITPAGVTSGDNFSFSLNNNSWIVLIDSIRLENNIGDTRGKGQTLVLQCKTKYPIDTSTWTMMYRTTAGNFYSRYGDISIPISGVDEDTIYFSS